MEMLASEWGTGQVLWSMIWFVCFFIWIWLLIAVFSDIFRSRDLGGVAKAIWVIFVLVIPYFGVFVYLIARGHKMHEHAAEAMEAQQQAQQEYIRQAAGTTKSPAEEIARLSELKDKGTITEAEFQSLKAKTLSS